MLKISQEVKVQQNLLSSVYQRFRIITKGHTKMSAKSVASEIAHSICNVIIL